MRNNGTVPLKLHKDLVWDAGSSQLIIDNTTVFQEFDGDFEGKQLEPGQSLWLIVKVCIPDENRFQNLSAGLTLTITGVQWNEYVP